MGELVLAQAFCNNGVAYIAWKADEKIEDCLGFMITRLHLDENDREVERRILPAWVAFETQSNPTWHEQDMSVWPAQKFSWRDLTLRRRRDSHDTRQGDYRVQYEIAPVSNKPRGAAVPPSPTALPGKYTGKPIALYFCGAPIRTNILTVTNRYGDVSAAFTNGILSTQNLRKQLGAKEGELPSKKVLEERLAKPGDKVREFLAGDVLAALRRLFERAEAEDATIHLALYELADPELIELLKFHQERLHVVLSTAGSKPPKKGSGEKPLWDVTNKAARTALKKLMGARLHNRWFNNSAHIGHNKFAVLVDKTGRPAAVWSGSTNWTRTGLCAQTNNTIIIESPDVAQAYLDYWMRLRDDKLPTPKPAGAQLGCNQGAQIREANAQACSATVDGGRTKVQLWYSPNTPTVGTAQTRTVPPDLEEVFRLMKRAKDAIFFLVFNPGRTAEDGKDINTVIAAGITIGRLDSSLFVSGAISDPTAMPGYAPEPAQPAKKGARVAKPPLPAIFTPNGLPNVLMIRAAAVGDLIGDFQKELLGVGHAIIHDKVVVIDPMSKTDCIVITGSHNLGFKASYANDENMLIIRGNRPLALAYAAHVLDVYDHYKFRSVLEQRKRDAMLENKGKVPKRAAGKGFLWANDRWQDAYFAGHKGREPAYFLSAKL